MYIIHIFFKTSQGLHWTIYYQSQSQYTKRQIRHIVALSTVEVFACNIDSFANRRYKFMHKLPFSSQSQKTKTRSRQTNLGNRQHHWHQARLNCLHVNLTHIRQGKDQNGHDQVSKVPHGQKEQQLVELVFAGHLADQGDHGQDVD